MLLGRPVPTWAVRASNALFDSSLINGTCHKGNDIVTDSEYLPRILDHLAQDSARCELLLEWGCHHVAVGRLLLQGVKERSTPGTGDWCW